jgi:hypothetical protein
MDPGGLDEHRLGILERRGVDLARGGQHSSRRHRHIASVDCRASMRHGFQGARHPDGISCGTPRQSEPVDQPRRRRQVPVPLDEVPALHLGEAPESLDVDQLGGSLELCEVVLDPRVRQLLEHLRAEGLDRGAQLAHNGRSHSLEHMLARYVAVRARGYDGRHTSGEVLDAAGSSRHLVGPGYAR